MLVHSGTIYQIKLTLKALRKNNAQGVEPQSAEDRKIILFSSMASGDTKAVTLRGGSVEGHRLGPQEQDFLMGAQGRGEQSPDEGLAGARPRL